MLMYPSRIEVFWSESSTSILVYMQAAGESAHYSPVFKKCSAAILHLGCLSFCPSEVCFRSIS